MIYASYYISNICVRNEDAYIKELAACFGAVRNFNETKTTNMTAQANASQKQKSCKLTHKSRHTIVAHLLLPQRTKPYKMTELFSGQLLQAVKSQINNSEEKNFWIQI